MLRVTFDQYSERHLSSDFESSPALDDQRNEEIGMLCVIVLQADAEQQRLAFADKGVDICVGEGLGCLPLPAAGSREKERNAQ